VKVNKKRKRKSNLKEQALNFW